MKRRTHRHDAEISLIANAVTGRDGQAKIHPLLGPARHRFHIEWMKWHYLRRRLATLRSGAVIRQEVLARSASTSALAVSAAISALYGGDHIGNRTFVLCHLRRDRCSVARSDATDNRSLEICNGKAGGDLALDTARAPPVQLGGVRPHSEFHQSHLG